MLSITSITSCIYSHLCRGRCRRDKYSLGEPPTEFGLGVQSMLEWLALIYHSIEYTKIDVDTSGGETWKLGSAPNLAINIPENTVNSGDFNGGILVSICALGEENRNLPRFLFTYSYTEFPSEYRTVLYTVGKVLSRRS